MKNENNITPNCSLCKWLLKHTSLMGTIINYCSAQGFKGCDICWNNEECKNLYEKEVQK